MALTKLDPNVIGTDSSGASKLTSAGGLVQLHSTGLFAVANNSANSFIVAANGNIGIGNSTPSNTFSVNGTLYVSADAASTTTNWFFNRNANNNAIALQLGGGTGGGSSLSVSSVNGNFLRSFNGSSFAIGTDNAAPLVLGTTDTERMRIAANGNVGIGTSTPSDALVVSGNTTMSGNLLTVGNYTTNTTLQFQTYSNGLTKINFYDNNSTEGLYMKTVGDTYGGVMSFGARWDDDEDKINFKMYQASAGASYNVRVGVGTSDPQETLDVVGSMNIRNDLTGGQGYTGGYRFTRSNAANTAAYIQNGGNQQGVGMTSGDITVPSGTATMLAKTHWGGLALVGYAGTGQQGYRLVAMGYGTSPTVLYSASWVGGATITFSQSDYRLFVSQSTGSAMSFWCVFLGV